MKAKKLVCMLGLLLYARGLINGIGYSCWIGEYVTAIGVVVLGVMALPTAVRMYYMLTDDD